MIFLEHTKFYFVNDERNFFPNFGIKFLPLEITETKDKRNSNKTDPFAQAKLRSFMKFGLVGLGKPRH